MELVLKFCSSTKYQKEYCTLDILYIFGVFYFISTHRDIHRFYMYMPSVHFRTFQFPTNT